MMKLFLGTRKIAQLNKDTTKPDDLSSILDTCMTREKFFFPET